MGNEKMGVVTKVRMFDLRFERQIFDILPHLIT